MIGDDVFKNRVLAALEKPKKGKIVAIINSGFFLWLMTLLVVSAGGAYLTSYQQCRKDAEDAIERHTKIQRELFQRELRMREIIMTAPTVADMRSQLKQPISYYPEYSGFPILLLQEGSAAFLNRVIDLTLANGKPLPRAEMMALYPISRGTIPDWMTDKDIPLLREYAMTVLAQATPIPLPGYGLGPFQPECGLKTLWGRFISDPATSNIRAHSGTLPPPRVLPLPQGQTPPPPRMLPLPQSQAPWSGQPATQPPVAAPSHSPAESNRARP